MTDTLEIAITLTDVKFYKHCDEILIIEFENEATLELPDIAEFQNHQVSIMGDEPCKVVNIICPDFSVTKEAREYGNSEEAYKYLKASAIVCNTLAHRILGNFFIKIQRPPRPTRMFNDLKSAIAWLETID